MNLRSLNLRICYCCLCLALLLGSTAMSSPSRTGLETTGRGDDDVRAVLTIQAPPAIRHGSGAMVMARLLAGPDKPLAGEELSLVVDLGPALHATTDINGLAVFRLSPALDPGAHILRTTFSGNPWIGGAIAWSKLEVQPSSQGESAAALQDRPVSNQALLTVPSPVRVRLGEPATIAARLMADQDSPLAGEDLVLFVDLEPELHARTDANGVAVFHLPPEDDEDGHTVRVVYVGNATVGAAIAVGRLHVSSTAETQLAAEAPRAPVAAVAVEPATAPLPIATTFLPPPAPTPAQVAMIIPTVQPSTPAQPTPDAPRSPIAAVLGPRPTATPPIKATATVAPAPVDLAIGGTTAPESVENWGPADAVVIAAHTTTGAVTPTLAESAQPRRSAGAPATIQPTALQAFRKQPAVAQSIALISATSELAVGHLGAQGALALGAVLVLGLALSPVLISRRRAWVQPFQLRVDVLPGLQRPAVPMAVWVGMRILSVGIALGLALVLFVRPATGLLLFWGVFIPLLPLLFFLAPSLWRNICPMAALNQTPRLFNFARARTLPKWMQEYGFVIGASLFLVLASSRKVLFNQNGPALAALILCALGMAFVMGNFFKGKSGWCSSICPLLPIQRIYGQTPFASVTHAHCQPCVACTKNCYDLSPKNAYLADLYDDQPHHAAYRKVFVGLFPGFILGFFLTPNPPAIPIWQMYAMIALASLVSLGTFFVVESFVKVTSNKITVVYAAVALNLFYWFNALTLGALIATPQPALFVWSLRTVVFALTLFWIYRTYRKEATFIELTLAPQTLHGNAGRTIAGPTDGRALAPVANPEVVIEPEGKRIVVEKNRTLLDIIESNNLPIEAGCRMGLCGADPICIRKGMDHLSKIGSDERSTLDRLGLAPDTRMACMARVRGNVTIGLTPTKPDVFQSSVVAGFKYDQAVERVVIVGNGIAGVTAADHIRRRHPKCEIHLIGRERHHLYNRMGITRLIYGRSAMQGLYLLPDQWYDDFNITCWLNTHVTTIDAQARRVTLGTGETLAYDRLILTTGSQSFVPPIEGFGAPGSFVLRTAEDAMAMRAYVQERSCRTAVVAGGGLLGLEAAYGLQKLGLTVTVLERSGALLSRQLDARGAQFLREYLEQMGIRVIMNAEAASVQSAPETGGCVQAVILHDGQSLPCDLFLAAAGIRAELDLARSINLAVNQGIKVDAEMRTSDPHVFAAGDVAEFDGRLYGLWPVAVSQAEVAATNAVMAADVASATYTEMPPVTMLKVVGIDLTSVGRIQPHSEQEHVIALEESAEHRYRKLIVADGRIVGAILLGYPQEAPGVTAAVRLQVDVTPDLDALQAGDWQSLSALA